MRRGTLGEVVPGFEIKVADEEGREVLDGTIEHLWVRGGSRALGYWQQLDKSQTCFRGEWVVSCGAELEPFPCKIPRVGSG